MAKVAAVISAGTIRDLDREARSALSGGADLAELRLDAVREIDSNGIRTIAAAVGPRSIATARSHGQGGARELRADARAALLDRIVSQRFAYVDIEWKSEGGRAVELGRQARRNGATIIASHHFSHPAVITQVEDALEACASLGDIAKVAVPASDLESTIELVDLARRTAGRKHRVALIGTGIAGTITRVLSDDLGQEIQYAAWGRTALPGQLSLATARRLRGREPMVLGLVGHPLVQSLSPVIHETALNALDLPGAYVPFDVPTEGIDALLHAGDGLHLRGFNVTSPYKESIVGRLDELDGDAERLGAVNTVVLGDGWTKGHNTDVHGFRLSLRSLGLRVGDRPVLVVGAGGAARAVVDVLLREGAKVQVTNRTFDRAEAFADSFDAPIDVVPMESLPRGGPWDLLVNATPAGSVAVPASGLPVPEAVLPKSGYVYDLVYNPPATPLIAAARRLGKPATSGLEMLLHQAAKSFELWTGQPAPVEAMRRAAKEALG